MMYEIILIYSHCSKNNTVFNIQIILPVHLVSTCAHHLSSNCVQNAASVRCVMSLVQTQVALDLALLSVSLSCDCFLNLTDKLVEQPEAGVLHNMRK